MEERVEGVSVRGKNGINELLARNNLSAGVVVMSRREDLLFLNDVMGWGCVWLFVFETERGHKFR